MKNEYPHTIPSCLEQHMQRPMRKAEAMVHWKDWKEFAARNMRWGVKTGKQKDQQGHTFLY